VDSHNPVKHAPKWGASLVTVPEDYSKAKAMNSGRQAPHFSEGMLISTSLLLPFFFFALLALQVGLPGLLAAREGGPTLFAVALASLYVATHAWSRYHHCRDGTSPRRIGRRI
jgi:hypothetical protein